jgi:hypothetical protein
MPRRPAYLKKSMRLQVDQLQRKCRYCKTHQNRRGFEKHETWCKRTWKIREELQALRTKSINQQLQLQAERMPSASPLAPAALVNASVNEEFIEGSSSMPMEVEYMLPGFDHQELTTGPSLHGIFPHLRAKYLFLIFNLDLQIRCQWPCPDLGMPKSGSVRFGAFFGEP